MAYLTNQAKNILCPLICACMVKPADMESIQRLLAKGCIFQRNTHTQDYFVAKHKELTVFPCTCTC